MSIKKVLIVDDSPVDRANMEAIVIDAGCLSVTAASGKEAMTKARAENPDLIFLDVIMPDLDGFATCRMLSQDPKTKHIPVVFTTSKNQKVDRVWGQMQGGKAYIVKPYTPEQIVTQIHAFS
jgi:twitching motility two-component system response regulator PilH